MSGLEGADWDLLKATQESLREHMTMIKELQEELAPYKQLYSVINEFMAELGVEGEITINTHSALAGDIMNALWEIDGGSPIKD